MSCTWQSSFTRVVLNHQNFLHTLDFTDFLHNLKKKTNIVCPDSGLIVNCGVGHFVCVCACVLSSQGMSDMFFHTFAQFVPATRQATSPPSLLAALIAFSVIGVNLSLLCSATTKVL